MRPEPELAELARLWGVMTSYLDIDSHRIQASRESLVSVAEALGAPISPDAASPKDVGLALRARRRELWGRTVEPVVVAWGGRLPMLRVRLPAGGASGSLGGRIGTSPWMSGSGSECRWATTGCRSRRGGAAARRW